MLVGSFEWLPKLTHVLGFTSKSEGYKSLFDGKERGERGIERETIVKFHSLVPIM